MKSRLWLVLLGAAACGGAPVDAPPERIGTLQGSSPGAALPASMLDRLAAAGHPRLWVTRDDLPKLRAAARPDNPIYKEGLRPAAEAARVRYWTAYFPGGAPNPKWPDAGLVTLGGETETDALTLAFMALVDPDAGARPGWAKMAKDLLMYVMNEADKGEQPGAPFRDPAFSTNDRSRHVGHYLFLVTDWIYDALSPDEKATIQRVALGWAKRNTSQYHASPYPEGVMDDPALVADPVVRRQVANNYRNAHYNVIAHIALTFDPDDFLRVDPGKPDAALGNTTGSYLAHLLYAWNYQNHALFAQEGRGGLPLEGGYFSYGMESAGAMQFGALAQITAGVTDPSVFGPYTVRDEQAYWDDYARGFLHSLSPARALNAGVPQLGPVYAVANYGQIERPFATYDQLHVFGPMAVAARRSGDRARLARLKWILREALEGGGGDFLRRVKIEPILHYLVFDPADGLPAPDPRPALPLAHVAAPQGRLLARTGWDPGASWLSFVCSFATIDHQMPYAGMFELWRKGAWLTKQRAGYFQGYGDAPDYQNTISIQNVPVASPPTSATNYALDRVAFERGGQFMFNAGDPTSRFSTKEGVYAFAECDATNLYNRRLQGGDANEVAHASRSLLWIEPDRVVVYDRATTKASGRFKRFNLNLTAAPALAGNQATATLPDGQRLFVTAVLPKGAAISTGVFEKDFVAAAGDEARYRIFTEAPGGPGDARFLHVLQGADAETPADSITPLESADGAFQGAVIGADAVVFKRSFADDPALVVLQVPAAGTTWVSGLSPGVGYSVTVTATSGGRTITLTRGGSVAADPGGVIVVE